MEYILINDTKLKVMMQKCDLDKWDISADRLDYTNPEAKKVFSDILKYAKREFGFDTSGQKVLLQLYPSRDGSCELFISCVGISDNKKTLFMSDDEESILFQKAYSFENAERLLRVCRILHEHQISADSSAWFDEGGRWYLMFSADDDIIELELLPFNALSFINEYGKSVSATALSLYLGEYGKPICSEHAIETLGAL